LLRSCVTGVHRARLALSVHQKNGWSAGIVGSDSDHNLAANPENYGLSVLVPYNVYVEGN